MCTGTGTYFPHTTHERPYVLCNTVPRIFSRRDATTYTAQRSCAIHKYEYLVRVRVRVRVVSHMYPLHVLVLLILPMYCTGLVSAPHTTQSRESIATPESRHGVYKYPVLSTSSSRQALRRPRDGVLVIPVPLHWYRYDTPTCATCHTHTTGSVGGH